MFLAFLDPNIDFLPTFYAFYGARKNTIKTRYFRRSAHPRGAPPVLYIESVHVISSKYFVSPHNKKPKALTIKKKFCIVERRYIFCSEKGMWAGAAAEYSEEFLRIGIKDFFIAV